MKYTFSLRLTGALMLLMTTLGSAAQTANVFADYIEQYKDVAIEQMRKHGVPASITLAQGLLESGAGTSMLAERANNHFGIKTGGNWSGPYVLKDDDARQEKFRKYDNARQSYEDHSLFLRNGQRYSSLFSLEPTDYRGWANGLKVAGYATNPQYAQRLIDLIERYGLDRYDEQALGGRHHKQHHGDAQREQAVAPLRKPAPVASAPVPLAADAIKCCNGTFYVVAQKGDTYASIAQRWKLKETRLRHFNEVSATAVPEPGHPVYLQKKAQRGSSQLGSPTHIVRGGESMHDIAQQYAIQLPSLYQLNHLPSDYVPKAGDVLRLR